jgi:hypothetical protein
MPGGLIEGKVGNMLLRSGEKGVRLNQCKGVQKDKRKGVRSPMSGGRMEARIGNTLLRSGEKAVRSN